MFTPWEKATEVPAAATPGLLAPAAAAPCTALCSLALALFLWPSFGLAALPIALVFGRLLALDLTTYTLPNIYTWPLIAIGFTFAILHGQFTQALLAGLLLAFLNLTLTRGNLRMGLGGGDLKLLAALFAFLPLTSAFWAIALGCLFWMPIAMLKPKAMVPFGVPLILGWSLLLRAPHLPNWLLSTIS